jgi:sRNA-binding protein
MSVAQIRRARYQAIAAAITVLAEVFPRCFTVYEQRRRPLKLKIHLDILAALDGAITPTELRRALGVYCSNATYLTHIVKGAWRLNLDGEPAGTVTADEEAQAKARLASLRATKEIKAAAVKAQAPSRTAAAKVQVPPAKRLSLTDLKAAALARKTNARHRAGGRP